MLVKEQTILVVDDADDTRFMLKRMLELNGCRVVEATDGREAVKLAAKSCPDLILMDLNMPNLDGLAAIERIRKLKGKGQNVPIIAMTAYDTYGMREAAREAGCNEYVDKPNDLDYLKQVLSHYLGWLV